MYNRPNPASTYNPQVLNRKKQEQKIDIVLNKNQTLSNTNNVSPFQTGNWNAYLNMMQPIPASKYNRNNNNSHQTDKRKVNEFNANRAGNGSTYLNMMEPMPAASNYHRNNNVNTRQAVNSKAPNFNVNRTGSYQAGNGSTYLNMMGPIPPASNYYRNNMANKPKTPQFNVNRTVSYQTGNEKNLLSMEQTYINKTNPNLTDQIQKKNIQEDNQQIDLLEQEAEIYSNSSKEKKLQIQKEKVQKEDQQIPEYLLCPISQDIMRDPVMLTVCGHSFENSVIKDWLSKSKTCPLCKTQADQSKLMKNFALFSALQIYNK